MIKPPKRVSLGGFFIFTLYLAGFIKQCLSLQYIVVTARSVCADHP